MGGNEVRSYKIDGVCVVPVNRAACAEEVGGSGAGGGGSAKNRQCSHAAYPPPPLSLHTLGVACLARQRCCLLGWTRDVGEGGFREVEGSWVTCALLRRGAGRQALGIEVGGVGTRLAGYSRRWMALTGNRLLKQHDISWNEGPHPHPPLPSTVPPSDKPHPPSVALPPPSFTLSHLTPSCPAQMCSSMAFPSAAWTTWHLFSLMAPVTFLNTSSLPSQPASIPFSFQIYPYQTMVINCEAVRWLRLPWHLKWVWLERFTYIKN